MAHGGDLGPINDAVFQQVDTDGSGTISFKEFSTWWTRRHVTISGVAPDASMVQNMRKQWQAHDTDADGQLDRHEFAAALADVASGDWREAYDERKGKSYYYNKVTRETRWAEPSQDELVDTFLRTHVDGGIDPSATVQEEISPIQTTGSWPGSKGRSKGFIPDLEDSDPQLFDFGVTEKQGFGQRFKSKMQRVKSWKEDRQNSNNVKTVGSAETVKARKEAQAWHRRADELKRKADELKQQVDARDQRALIAVLICAALLLPIGIFSLYQHYTNDNTESNTEEFVQSLSTGGIGEVGTVEELTDQWQTVFLNERYSHPVVLAGLPGLFSEGATVVDDQAVPRIRNIDYGDGAGQRGWSFEIRLQEQPCAERHPSDERHTETCDSLHCDTQHSAERISWLAIDSGSYHLPNGKLLQAGHIQAAGSAFQTVVTTPFEEEDEVIVVTQVQTYGDDHFVKTRQRAASGYTRGAFDVRLEPAEGSEPHGEETIGFVATAAAGGTIGIMNYETSREVVDRTARSNNVKEIVFSRNFTEAAPHIFGSIASRNNDAAILMRNLVENERTVIRIEEDTCSDRETTRENAEAVNLLVIGAGGDHVLRGDQLPIPQVKCEATNMYMAFVEVGQYISWSAAKAMAGRYAYKSGSNLAVITSAQEQQCLVQVTTIVQEEYHETGIGWLGGTDADFTVALHDVTSLRHGQGWVSDQSASSLAGWSGSTSSWNANDGYRNTGLGFFECGSLGRILGPVGRGGYLSKTYSGLPAHETLRVELDFVRLDSWDNEQAAVFVDGSREWRATLNHNRGSNLCLGSSRDQSYSVFIEIAHTDSSVTINVTSELNEEIDNEAFGIANIIISTHSSTDTSWRWINADPWEYGQPVRNGQQGGELPWHQGVPASTGVAQSALFGYQPSGDHEHYLVANWPTYDPGEWHDCRSEHEAEDPPLWPRCFYQLRSVSRDVSSREPTADCKCISIPHRTHGLPATATSRFSVTTVFNMTENTPFPFVHWRSVFMVGEVSGELSPALYILPANNTADEPRHHLHVRTSTRLNNDAGCTTNGTIAAGARTHVTVVADYDSNGAHLYVYLNGDLGQGCTYQDPSSVFTYTAPLFIGGDPFYSGFDGVVELLCLHQGALSQSTVTSLLQSEMAAVANGVSVDADGSVAEIESQTMARVLFEKPIPFRVDQVDRRIHLGVDTFRIPQSNLMFPDPNADPSTFSVEFELKVEDGVRGYWRNVMQCRESQVSVCRSSDG